MQGQDTGAQLYLDVRQVATRFGVSVDTIYRWKREGAFPKAVPLSPGCVRWRLSDLEAWEGTLGTCFAFDLDGLGLPMAFVTDPDGYEVEILER